MPVLLLTNNPNDWQQITHITRSTATAGRDAAYQPHYIAHQTTAGGGRSARTDHPQGATDNYWLHCRLRTATNAVGTNADGHFLRIWGPNNELVAALDVLDGVLRAQAGAVTVAGLTYSADTTYEIDLNVRTANSDPLNVTVVRLYVNGTLIATASTNAVLPRPAFITWDWDTVINSGNGESYVSEVVATDNEQTIGWRVAKLTPGAVGALAQWDGNVASLDDATRNTSVTSDAAGERLDFAFSAYGGAATTTKCRGVFVKSNARRGPTGPNTLKHFLRKGGINYDNAANHVLDPVQNRIVISDFAVNPETGLPWNTADIGGFTAGLLSA